MRRFAYALSLSLLASTALAGGLGDMTPAERDAFRAEVKQYLLDNPEVIMQAMQALQDRQDQAAVKADVQKLSTYSDAINKDPASWVGGTHLRSPKGRPRRRGAECGVQQSTGTGGFQWLSE